MNQYLDRIYYSQTFLCSRFTLTHCLLFHSQAGTHVRTHRHNVSSLQNNLITCSTSRDRLCEWTKCSRIWVKTIQAKESVEKKVRENYLSTLFRILWHISTFPFPYAFALANYYENYSSHDMCSGFGDLCRHCYCYYFLTLLAIAFGFFKTHLISAKFRSS